MIAETTESKVARVIEESIPEIVMLPFPSHLNSMVATNHIMGFGTKKQEIAYNRLCLKQVMK